MAPTRKADEVQSIGGAFASLSQFAEMLATDAPSSPLAVAKVSEPKKLKKKPKLQSRVGGSGEQPAPPDSMASEWEALQGTTTSTTGKRSRATTDTAVAHNTGKAHVKAAKAVKNVHTKSELPNPDDMNEYIKPKNTLKKARKQQKIAEIQRERARQEEEHRAQVALKVRYLQCPTSLHSCKAHTK